MGCLEKLELKELLWQKMNDAVIISDVIKRYGEQEALKSVSLNINPGELFGLIGPDGAGKTSLIRILATLLVPDSGEVNVLGHDVVKDFEQLRKMVGYMPGRFSLYQDLSVEENLTLFASIHNTTIEQNYHLIKDIYNQIEPFRKRKAGALSGGMKQKLALSCAMIHEPEILYLDEPTTGVDAVSRNEFWDMLAQLKSRGITIIVSTPYMDEAELCDRVALIQNGNILTVNTPQGIVDGFGKELYALRTNNKLHLVKDLEAFAHTATVHAFGGYFHYTDQRESFDSSELERYLKSCGHTQIEIKAIQPEIEDCFMALMTDHE